MYPLDDTIAAIASPPGGAARGIVRLSGPAAVECLGRLFSPGDGQPLTSRPFPCAVAGALRLPNVHSPLPCEVYLWCSGPACPRADNATASRSPQTALHVRSYTGQPVAEVHTLGSPPLLQIVLRSLCDAGARLAGPGEFTLRAFLAGRLDLGQAEAVLGVIDAAGPAELRVALGQLAGGLARPLHRLRDALLELLAHLEAGFDFADEELPFITQDELQQRLADAEAQLAMIDRQMASRGDTASAPRAVLVGRPNSGKSSLWNALVGESAALVSDRPGTTRDYLTAELDFGGVPCQLVDTAGRSRDGRVAGRVAEENNADLVAQRLAAEQREAAEIEVLCVEASRSHELPVQDSQDRAAGQQIIVLTKCDLDGEKGDGEKGAGPLCMTHPSGRSVVRTSSVTGEGIDDLRAQLRQKAIAAGSRGALAATALRCGESVRLAGQSVGRARRVARGGQQELAAAELRIALDELGKVTGAVYTEDVLNRVFSRFCVGK